LTAGAGVAWWPASPIPVHDDITIEKFASININIDIETETETETVVDGCTARTTSN